MKLLYLINNLNSFKMKKLLLISLLALAIQSQAQNVGIGNPTPAEKLDVTGNINVTGTIKANGVGGTAGQVLTNNGNGSMSWNYINKYPNSRSFTGAFNNVANTYQTYTFIVPNNITEIWTQCWKGGSGGGVLPITITNTTYAKGGDAGSYLSGIIKVVPGETLTLIVGNGGTSGVEGGITQILRGALPIFGINSFGLAVADIDPVTNTNGVLEYVTGQSGEISTFSYQQAGTSLFYRTFTGGKGGKAYPLQDGGYGVTASYDVTSGAMVSFVNNGSIGLNLGAYGGNGAVPGGGGGIGYGNSVGFGGRGGYGLIILHW
jgi:hypothetical protein